MIFDSLDSEKQDLLLKHLNLVIEKNKTLNLTRIDTTDKGILLHIEDSLSCIEEFNQQDGPFLDIGTGGGFPGIPLAIVSERPGVLIDSVKKKASCVQEIIDELGISNQIKALGIRSEDYAQSDPKSFKSVVLRAVSSFPVIEELASPFLDIGGRLIALRGKETKESLDEAKTVGEKLGLDLISVRNLFLDDTYERNICVFEKVGEPSIHLPRRAGMANKRPIQ